MVLVPTPIAAPVAAAAPAPSGAARPPVTTVTPIVPAVTPAEIRALPEFFSNLSRSP